MPMTTRSMTRPIVFYSQQSDPGPELINPKQEMSYYRMDLWDWVMRQTKDIMPDRTEMQVCKGKYVLAYYMQSLPDVTDDNRIYWGNLIIKRGERCGLTHYHGATMKVQAAYHAVTSGLITDEQFEILFKC